MFFGIKVLQLSVLSFGWRWSFLSAGGRQSKGRTSVSFDTEQEPTVKSTLGKETGEKEWTGTAELRWKGNQNS